MLESKIYPEDQCRLNCLSWLNYSGFNTKSMTLIKAMPDRCYYDIGEEHLKSIKNLCEQLKIEESPASEHGPDVIIGYRECRTRGSAQLVVHASSLPGRNVLEMDFDYWGPVDLVGFFGHMWEITVNKLKKKKTDPFKVAKMLKSRGILPTETTIMA